MTALPHPTWPKRECLMQKAHRFTYDRAYRAAGMTIVEVETRQAFVDALSDRTAMISVLARAGTTPARGDGPPPMTAEECLELGRKAGVPVLIDAASELPPAANLTKFTGMGFDLVVFSGGKGIRGPQGTGILAGRADLVEAARLNMAPFPHIGRGMKVPKEEIVGFLVALDRYARLDHDAVLADWSRKAARIADRLKGVPGLSAAVKVNPLGFADVELTWDEGIIPISVLEARARLKAGEPRIVYSGTTIRTRNLREGEEDLVARRLRHFFSEEAKRRT